MSGQPSFSVISAKNAKNSISKAEENIRETLEVFNDIVHDEALCGNSSFEFHVLSTVRDKVADILMKNGYRVQKLNFSTLSVSY